MDEVNGRINKDKDTGISYGCNPDGTFWYRLSEDAEWVLAGHIDRMEEAKLPVDVMSLMLRRRHAAKR